MKSGTNWVCRILNQHPEIHCIGEFHWENFFRTLDRNVQNVAPRRQPRLNDVVRPQLEQMVQRCLTEMARPDASWIGDRTPTTIEPVVISNAPHIVVQRDFRDVIVSRMFHLYNHPRVTNVFENFPEMKRRLEQFEKNRWYFRDHPTELLDNETIVRDSAREWCQFIDSDRQTSQQHPETPILFVKYEDLHTEFSTSVATLMEFLELSPVDISKDLTPGHDAENPDEANRKGQVGDWRNYMRDDVRAWIQEEAGDHLQSLGYIESSRADW